MLLLTSRYSSASFKMRVNSGRAMRALCVAGFMCIAVCTIGCIQSTAALECDYAALGRDTIYVRIHAFTNSLERFSHVSQITDSRWFLLRVPISTGQRLRASTKDVLVVPWEFAVFGGWSDDRALLVRVGDASFDRMSATAELLQWDHDGAVAQLRSWNGFDTHGHPKLMHIAHGGRYLGITNDAGLQTLDASTLRLVPTNPIEQLLEMASPFVPSVAHPQMLTQGLRFMVFKRTENAPNTRQTTARPASTSRNESWVYVDRLSGRYGMIPETRAEGAGATEHFIDAGESIEGKLLLLYSQSVPGGRRRLLIRNTSLASQSAITVEPPTLEKGESAIVSTTWDSVRRRVLMYQTAIFESFPRARSFEVLDYSTGTRSVTMVDIASAFRKVGDRFVLRRD